MAAEAVEVVYKTKVVQFLGRSTSIVLQNDNGPCPLLAICNVLLLKNVINLSSNESEVSLQRLLSLVAERLIDSNSNVQGKDDEYVNNQQQNIADAMDLLPRLGNGIDVNVQFRKINDFEFTRECAIFDLLDIPLYHGWIVDPQDTETALVIGPRSYNMLIGELIAFETWKSEGKNKHVEEEPDASAAATAAALGVPAPSFASGRSFDDCAVSITTQRKRGDREEEEELIRVLNLSKAEYSDLNVSVPPATVSSHSFSLSEESTQIHMSLERNSADSSAPFKGESERLCTSNLFSASEEDILSDSNGIDNSSLTKLDAACNNSETVSEGTDMLMKHFALPVQSTGEGGSEGTCTCKDPIIVSEVDRSVPQGCREDKPTSQYKLTNNVIGCDSTVFPTQASPCTDSCTNASDMRSDSSEVVTLTLGRSDPKPQGGEDMLAYTIPSCQNKESVYKGQLIKNFLENSASQLTIYGLFCLQEGLKERELCVFFRNNHFSTIFKYNGELFLLATDQGYLHQPDLVWEKLNEVNGDTLFMTSNFTEFKAEDQGTDCWNEQHATTNTSDYVATLGKSAPSSSSINSDLQLAIELQQQEFEQQSPQLQQQQLPKRQHQSQQQQKQQLPQRQHKSQQRQHQPQQQHKKPQHHQQQSQRRQQQHPQQQEHPLQQPSVIGRSRLVIGPQVPRNSGAPQRNDSKPNDKCTLM